MKLLKVIVQPVFVDEEDGYLVERQAEPTVVAAKDWDDYRTPGGVADQAWEQAGMTRP